MRLRSRRDAQRITLKYSPATAALIAFFLLLGTPVQAKNATSLCKASKPDGPVLVTADCIDELYNQPVVDHETDVAIPTAHYHVSGHFENTSIRFNYHFPPKVQWDGRFFQFAYPTQTENATQETIGFGLDSGAYTVQVTGVSGYHAEAAAAKFSKLVAARYYGEPSRQIYGYLYGGSGGSLQTVGGIENTVGVWDGAVSIVQAIPISAPNGPAIRAMAGLVLKNKKTLIQNALKPGGSGDPYDGLGQVEQAILLEATKLGISTRTWEDFDAVANSSTLAILMHTLIKTIDPTYVDDFWSKPGYLGMEKSALGERLRSNLVDFNATVQSIKLDKGGVPVGVELYEVPAAAAHDIYGYDFTLLDSDGKVELGALRGTLDQSTRTVIFNDISVGTPNNRTLLDSLNKGAQLRINNRWFIAIHAYYRHQVPDRAGLYGFDALRKTDGSPIYPQRSIDISKLLSESTSGGGTHTGDIKGKMIVVQNLMDSDAFPWHADWYRSQVKKALGERFEDNYRIWYSDNVDHNFEEPTETRRALIAPYTGIYQQALRDLSSWVERGVKPPAKSHYTVTEDNSIQILDETPKRGGVQPMVHLTVGGAVIEAPPGTGQVVSAEWDFLGTGDFGTRATFSPNQIIHVEASMTYNSTGDFIPVLRVASQREGDAETRDSQFVAFTSSTFILSFAEMTTLTVKAIFDPVCPWCYIGAVRLLRAVDYYKETVSSSDIINLSWHSYQIDPHAVTQPLLDKMASKFGSAQVPRMHEQLRDLGRTDGIDFSFDSTVGDTRDAHRLVQLAKQKGQGDKGQTETKLVMEMMKMYFEQGGDITSVKDLGFAAQRAGIKRDEAIAWLVGGGGGEEVDRDIEEAQKLGIRGVPWYEFNGQSVVKGAIDESAFLKELISARANALKSNRK
ncbi:hypothetical protein NM208_g8895 [Fusarium decemcellulare]|uniref:Uncharacterized protein n=1 Tax=Fusarium decemcellulare TaxID=57161 RepID=A0ACC1S3K7_9HYPO|nr:hypothetical protein NM208_g8895 [Fusarium decemcellulare]